MESKTKEVESKAGRKESFQVVREKWKRPPQTFPNKPPLPDRHAGAMNACDYLYDKWDENMMHGYEGVFDDYMMTEMFVVKLKMKNKKHSVIRNIGSKYSWSGV